jgi:hypothetical protein
VSRAGVTPAPKSLPLCVVTTQPAPLASRPAALSQPAPLASVLKKSSSGDDNQQLSQQLSPLRSAQLLQLRPLRSLQLLQLTSLFIGVRRGVFRGVEDGRRLPALWVGHPIRQNQGWPTCRRVEQGGPGCNFRESLDTWLRVTVYIMGSLWVYYSWVHFWIHHSVCG